MKRDALQWFNTISIYSPAYVYADTLNAMVNSIGYSMFAMSLLCHQVLWMDFF